jgi:hypothetical protein
MTMIGLASRPSDGADPRRTQKRVAVSPSGRQVLVDITGDDRLRLIRHLPGRWPEVVMARERGDTLEQIHRWARVPLCHPDCRFSNSAVTEDGLVLDQSHVGPPCLRVYLAKIYAGLETELHDLAARRARLMV